MSLAASFIPMPRFERGLCNDTFIMLPISLAAKIGEDEALFLSRCYSRLQWGYENIKESLAKNSPLPTYYKIFDGRLWYRNTLEDWQTFNFPYWSIDKIGRVAGNLKQDGFVLTMTDPDQPTDRALWYSIDLPNFDAFERMGVACARLGEKRLGMVERAEKARQERLNNSTPPMSLNSEDATSLKSEDGDGCSEIKNMGESESPSSENKDVFFYNSICTVDYEKVEKTNAHGRVGAVKVETTPPHLQGFETMNQPYSDGDVSQAEFEVRQALKAVAKSVNPLTLQSAVTRIVEQGFTGRHITAYFNLYKDTPRNFWKADPRSAWKQEKGEGVRPQPGTVANVIEDAHTWHKKGKSALPRLGEQIIDPCVTIQTDSESAVLSPAEEEEALKKQLGILF
jgi:hypothetical protein